MFQSFVSEVRWNQLAALYGIFVICDIIVNVIARMPLLRVHFRAYTRDNVQGVVADSHLLAVRFKGRITRSTPIRIRIVQDSSKKATVSLAQDPVAGCTSLVRCFKGSSPES
jgi:hypothetical protein